MSTQSGSGVCPVPMGDPPADLVERVLEKHHALEEKRKKERQRSTCHLLGRSLSPSRLLNTKWCLCGSCVIFTTTHDNVCCRELVEEADEMDGSHQRREIARRLRDKLKDMKGQCIVQHPSFHKVVLDSEVSPCFYRYSYLFKHYTGFTRAVDSVHIFRIFRYYAYRSFVAWAYGHLGLGKRYELPACVRAAIMAEYPSNTGNYVGFKRTSDKDPPLECDEDEWRDRDF
ncbi:hypothetical protein COOONC_17477 [Cooperia oncophora]